MSQYIINTNNDNHHYFNKINSLPNELVDIICSYIPEVVSIFLTKQNYLKNHYLIKKFIDKRNIENYIRAMVRQDNYFVFEQMLNENWKKWLSMKKCYYKNCIYSNYLIFLDHYCLDNESSECRKKIAILFKEQGLSKNQHKKNVIKYIRWKL